MGLIFGRISMAIQYALMKSANTNKVPKETEMLARA
jgi:hypothetical protein